MITFAVTPRPSPRRKGSVVTPELRQAILATRDSGQAVAIPVNGDRVKLRMSLRSHFDYHGVRIGTRTEGGQLYVWVKADSVPSQKRR